MRYTFLQALRIMCFSLTGDRINTQPLEPKLHNELIDVAHYFAMNNLESKLSNNLSVHLLNLEPLMPLPTYDKEYAI